MIVASSARPRASFSPRRSSSGCMPATPIATSVAPPPRAAEGVADDHRRRRPEASAERIAKVTRRGVGVAREEHDPVVTGRVRAVDAGARTDEPVLGLGDDEVVAAPTHCSRLAEDHLDVVGGLLDAALGPGDDLLGDDEHVALAQASRAIERVGEEGGEVVARPYSGMPSSGDDLDHSGARSPSTARVGLVAAVDVEEDGGEVSSQRETSRRPQSTARPSTRRSASSATRAFASASSPARRTSLRAGRRGRRGPGR